MQKRKIKTLRKLQAEVLESVSKVDAKPVPAEPRSVTMARQGANSMGELIDTMLAAGADALAGVISPAAGNTYSGLCARTPKAVDLVCKYGKTAASPGAGRNMMISREGIN